MLDANTYKILLQFIGQLRGMEKQPGEQELDFMKDDSWLSDTAVTDRIEYRRGAWDISLVFAHYKNPLRLLVRRIISCTSSQKADMAAFYIRRQAAKDPRGTLEVLLNDFSLCVN